MAVHLLYKLVQLAFSLYELAILLYVLLSWLRPAANRWTELLRSVVEPLLTPIRRLLIAKLPTSLQIFDLSPVLALLVISIARQIVGSILGIFL